MPSEALLARTFAELADTLVDDFDVVELLTVLSERCARTLDASAAGVMLRSPDGDLRTIALSSHAAEVVEMFELQAEEGPVMECYLTGVQVSTETLAPDEGRWPRFQSLAHETGIRSA